MTKPAKEYLAYQGDKFSIEWYHTEAGNSPALDFFNWKLGPKDKAKLFLLFERLANHGKIYDKHKFRNEGNGIYAFKPIPFRFLCFFFKDGKIIITNAFEKRQQKLPTQEKKKALAAMGSYESRIQNGTYYE